jgi:hypothetical protein
VVLTGKSQRSGEVDVRDLDFRRRPYDWLAANAQAQRARALFVAELARRAPRLTIIAVHPGAVLTEVHKALPWYARALVHTVMRPAFVRPEIGAMPALRLAAMPDLVDASGCFFDRFRRARDRFDTREAHVFWEECEKLVAERRAA